MQYDISIQNNAIKLRTEKRLSTNEISLKLNIPKNTIINWLKPFKLTSEEIRQRKSNFLLLERFMETHICEKCKKSFEIEVYVNRKGEKVPADECKTGKFCTRKCANSRVFQENKKKKIHCSLCGKDIEVGNHSPKTAICLQCKKKKHPPIICSVCPRELSIHNKSGLCYEHYKDSVIYKENLSKRLQGKTGGYRKNSGLSKHGWYRGYWCDSSWELAYAIYNLDHNIHFERNKSFFGYTYKGKKYKYYPDFIVNKQYIEIKGYFREIDSAKHKVVSNLLIITKKEIQPYLQYVIKKYGKKFIDLYEIKNTDIDQ